MASFWHIIPFVRLLIPFAVGIGLNIFFNINLKFSAIAFIVSVSCIWLSQKFIKLYLNWITGICISISMLFMGIFLNNLQKHLYSPLHFSKYKADYLIISLAEQPVIKEKSIKAFVKVHESINQNKSQPVKGKLLVYFKKDLQSLALKYGDVLIVKANYTDVNGPQNPFEFNYKRYLSFNQIFHQMYLSSNSYLPLKINKGLLHFKLAYSVQAYIKENLSKYVVTKSEVGVAQALLYGYDNDIDPDILKAYSNTGTLHVLAVSGMHVGVIYLVLGMLLRPLDNRKKLKWIKYPILLGFVWSYSILCGLSPSILRATVMISFFTVAEIINRRGNSYNTLAASAFLLVCINTNIIANVGFQLSYLAVLGIITVNPVLYRQLSFDTKIGDGIWKIVSVSIAAQFATFPIGMLYFHQFPVYFLFSNLLIIPLTTLIIYSGILLMVFSPIPFAGETMGFVVKHLIALTNFLVSSVEKMPYAYISGISISVIQTIIIYLICAFVFAYFLKPSKGFLMAFLIGIFTYITISAIDNFYSSSKKTLTLYNIKGHLALQAIYKNKSILIADSALIANSDKFHFHLQQHIWANKIKHIDTIYCNFKPVSYNFNKTNFLVDALPEIGSTRSSIIITGKNYIPLKNFKNFNAIKHLYINNSMSVAKQHFFKRFAESNNIEYTMLAKNGFVQLEIN
ncbi:MAG: ComEC/Rec2 family competence protein [Bacteroidia bacterium]